MSGAPELFSQATRVWFDESFAEPTPVQSRGWPTVARGAHTLLIAPTGSGKTLAAFLWALDRLQRLPADAAPGVRVVYVSPLKALVYDVERNLRAPLAGLLRTGERLGTGGRKVSVAVRTGDTSQRERAAMARRPGDVLVTTPESLYLMMGSRVRETLQTVEVIIVDEIHAMAGTKRGAHLSLTLERLASHAAVDPQRVGLSATARPVDEVARFLGGDRPVDIVDTASPPHLSLRVVMPEPPEAAGAVGVPAGGSLAEGEQGGSILGKLMQADFASSPSPAAQRTIWPALEAQLYDLIMEHHTTIVFVNNRSGTERLTHQLNERAEAEIALAHHGSLSRRRREQVEDMLKSGAVRAIVATSSLELGIDMGSVDLVVQVESPGAVSRGLQRIGRAGHGVGEISQGVMIPKYKGDLLECAVAARGMLDGALEPIRVPRNALDVLAQQIVAMCVVQERSVADIARIARRTYGYADLSDDALHGVLDMLSGQYPSTELADLRPRIVWERTTHTLTARRGARVVAMTNAGTIPDRGLYGVHVGESGPRIGELDEEMVFEARAGQTFILGASTWRILEITADRVIVTPAPGEAGQLPFWRGIGPGRPLEMGVAMGALLREVGGREDDAARAWLAERFPLDDRARETLLDYVREQQLATGHLPDDRTIVVERFRDEIGDQRICILSPLGSAVNAPWAMAIESMLSRRAGFEVNVLWSDDGVSLRFSEEVTLDDDEGPDRWVPDPDEVDGLVVEQLSHTALFAGVFRESAARALLLPRRAPGKRTPLWAQRQRAQRLLAVARQYPAFPIVLETYRECLQHVFDMQALKDVLRRLRRRELRLVEVETDRASPFARSLVFDYVAAWLYEGDAPLAERRAQALTLDRDLLRDLLGHAELRDLIDAGALAEVEAELQGLAGPYRARDPDDLHDLLRRLGDLTEAEIAARCAEPAGPWLDALKTASRAVPMRIAGSVRWVAAEDAAVYRDALGSMPPAGLPNSLLSPVDEPLRQLLVRYARTHGPFTTREVAGRWSLRPAQVSPILTRLGQQGRLVQGELRPGGVEREWCDDEVLRRIRRRSIAAVRGTLAPVGAEVLGRFLPRWHGVTGDERPYLEEALIRLEGVPLPFSELEGRLLPARLGDFEHQDLDLLTATGQWVWVGDGALGSKGGRVRLYRRDRVGLLHPELLPYEPPSELHERILGHLAERGASFLFEIRTAMAPADIRDVTTAVWDLVWAGRVTNDTLQPLRALASGRTRRPRSRRGAARSAGGRWSLVSSLVADAPPPTEREHARALGLIERHGILSRDSLGIEDVQGGFAALYPILKALEEHGRIRRGYFVEGLGGAQFAAPGAVDRLRACRDPDRDPEVLVLAAVDPANPWGAAVPWPETPASLTPRREAGASVVLVDGSPWFHLSRSGRQLTTFEPQARDDRDDLRIRALQALADEHPRHPLEIEKVDDDAASTTALLDALTRAGFERDYKGLRYLRRVR